MSNDNQDEIEQITKNPLPTTKVKDPKKFAAGKKLAEYNKKAKETNKLEKETKEEGGSWVPETSLTTILALLGLGLTAFDLFLRYKGQQESPPPPPPPSQPSQPPQRKRGME